MGQQETIARNARKKLRKARRKKRRRYNMHKNNEGYADPTAGQAIKSSARMPTHIYNVYSVINNVAGLHGLEIIGLRDKKTGKEWRRGPHG